MWPTKVKARIKHRGINAEHIFYVGYFAFLFGATISYSVVSDSFVSLIKYLGLGIMFLYMLYMNRKSGWKTWLILAVAYIVTLIIVRVSGTRLLLEILIFITAFKDIDFNKFIKRDFLFRLGIVLAVVGLGAIGVLNSRVSTRTDGVMRYAPGFNHPNALGLQVVFLSLEFVYLNRNKKNFWSFIIVFAALIFNYKITNSRTAMFALLILLPFLLMTKNARAKVFSNKYIGLMMKASFVVFLLLALALSFWYTKDNTILRSINNAFSYRLSLGHSYLFDYGILEPFGNNLETSNTLISELPLAHKRAFDIGYLHVLIRFGWIAICVWAIAYWQAMGFMQNWTGMMILFVISFYSMFETGTLFGFADPFLPLFSVLFYGAIRGLTTRVTRPKGDILLLTWVEGDNYGTVLQSWCLKQIINNPAKFVASSDIGRREVNILNYHVMMDNTTEKFENGLLDKLKRFKKRSLKQNKERLEINIRKLKLHSKFQQREQLFREFRQNELELYPDDIIDRKAELKKLPRFRTYLIGGDQVWNPRLLDSTFLLNWAPSDSVKISYAPSVCVNSVTQDDLKKYAPLRNFTKLSVREYTYAVKEISKFIGKEIEEVVDPVVLYGREALLKHCHINKTNGYCLSYILGSSKLSREYVKAFAQKNKLKIKAIIGVNKENILIDEMLDEDAIWNVSPLEMINLVFNSRIVITDSFHILVICVLLHKQFIILPREKSRSQQNNRITDFLKKINLENTFGYSPIDIEDTKFSNYEWALCDFLIEKQRKKSFEYLAKALGSNDNSNKLKESTRTKHIKLDEHISQQNGGKSIKVDYKDEKTEVSIKIINKLRRKSNKRKRQEKKMVDIIINNQKVNHAPNKKKAKKDTKDEKHQKA